jgi:hypothetical protein
VYIDFWNPLHESFSKSNNYVDLWGLSILRYNPQPTQRYDNASIAIVLSGDSSGYGNNNSENGIGGSNDSGDGDGNGSGGNGGGIDNGDGSNGGSGNKEVAATAMAIGANNNQLKVAAEKRRSWRQGHQQ